MCRVGHPERYEHVLRAFVEGRIALAKDPCAEHDPTKSRRWRELPTSIAGKSESTEQWLIFDPWRTLVITMFTSTSLGKLFPTMIHTTRE
jgi:hypothetical protein